MRCVFRRTEASGIAFIYSLFTVDFGVSLVHNLLVVHLTTSDHRDARSSLHTSPTDNPWPVVVRRFFQFFVLALILIILIKWNCRTDAVYTIGMHAMRTSAKKRKEAVPTRPVSFRLSAYLVASIDEEARIRGMTRSDILVSRLTAQRYRSDVQDALLPAIGALLSAVHAAHRLDPGFAEDMQIKLRVAFDGLLEELRGRYGGP